jgi:hypothetical protein
MSTVHSGCTTQVFLENGRFRPRVTRRSISLVFWCPYFESRFPTVDFQIAEMPIDLLGVGTDRLPGRFQLPTPNKSIGPSEVARDCFKAGCFSLPLVGGRFLNMYLTTECALF